MEKSSKQKSWLFRRVIIDSSGCEIVKMSDSRRECHGTRTRDEVAGREEPAEDFAHLCMLLLGKNEVTT